jgi:membrane associated rhomboid family serine protease
LTPENKRLPIATLLLIAANVGVAYVTLLHPEFPIEYGFRPEAPSLQTALESLFIHSNILHLLGNMVFLAAVGATVEQLSGSLRFATVYFASGLAGVATHWIFATRGGDAIPLVGASGCIAGCAAYYCMRYLRLRVPMAPKIGASVALVTVVWLVLQILGAFVHVGEDQAVSYWAHIGGFAMGLVLSVAFRTPDVGKLEADQAVLRQMGDRSPGAIIAAAEQQLSERPEDVAALQELALVHEHLGENEKEAEALFKLLDLMPEEKLAPVLERICSLKEANKIAPHKRLALAERFKNQDPSPSQALLMSVLNDPTCEQQRPDALLALATLLYTSAPDKAKIVSQELATKYPLHPATEIARAKGML